MTESSPGTGANRHRHLQLLPLAGLIAAFLLLYGRVLVDLSRAWATDANYSHGFLILPIAAYLIWERRGRLAATERRPAAAGLLIVGGSLIVLLAGTAGVEFFLMRISAIGVAAGIVVFLAGWRWLRLLLLPFAFSLLMIPVPPVVFYQVAFPLQLLATRFGVAILEVARIPVLREGNVIDLAHTTLEVTEACSGIRSLLSLFALAVVYGYFATPRRGPRVMIALSAIPIAIVSNGLRIAGTGMAAHYVSPAAASGFFHTFSGWAVFVTSFVMLVALASVLKLLLPPPAVGPMEGPA
jgi:exosortase